MTPLDPAGVLVEVDVHLPVQAVLDPPMPAQHLAVHPGARLATADEVAHLHTRLVFDRALADTHPDHLQILPLRLRTKTLRLRQDAGPTHHGFSELPANLRISSRNSASAAAATRLHAM